MKHASSRFFVGLFLVVAAIPWRAGSQEPGSVARIVGNIDGGQTVTLPGNLLPVATAENDRGRVDADLLMTDLILVLKRSPEQQAAFDAFVASQYDSTSPNYHHWLGPEEVGEKFGPSLADIGTISSWLAGHGLSVHGFSNDRMTIRFSGKAAQVEQVFHTEIHNLMVQGEPHFANMTDPQIAMALEPVVKGPKALHNFVPRPMHKLGGKAVLNTGTGKWERVPQTVPYEMGILGMRPGPQPNLGINQGSGTSASVIEDITPYDFATIYNVLPLWNESIDGTGQTIAIAGRSNVRSTDVASFRSIFGLPTGTFRIIQNGPDPGYCTGNTGQCTLADQVENALDVEWAGAVAKGATIDLVVTQQTLTNDAVYESANYVIRNRTAPILSVSYGLCELSLGTSGNAAYHNLWQTAATQGIAVFVPSGDAGSPACDQGLNATVPYSARLGLSVNGLASSPFDTAVGGTDFTWCSPTANAPCASGSPYWSSLNLPSTGANAQGYIPETPWNDTCTTPTAIAYIKSVASVTGLGVVSGAESACNFIRNNYATIYSRYGINLSFLVNAQGTGGGASSCITSDGSTLTTCSGGYGKPAWQTGAAGILTDGKRDIPDVSFFAGAGLWNSAYLICLSDAGACLTTTSPTNRPAAQEIGGTSASSPAMAGVMALINQKAGWAQGNPNSELYQLAARQSYPHCGSEGGSISNGCYFNDVAKGTNAMACTAGSPDCTISVPSNSLGVLSGHGATIGYDLATGLGTLNVANVVNAWPASTGTATATVTVSPSSNRIQVNQTLSVSVTVQGSSGTPSGSVTLSGGGYTSPEVTLSSGIAAFTIPANSLALGTATLSAAYTGDSTYAAATGTTTITVLEATKLAPTVTVTPASNSILVDQSLSVVVTVQGSSGAPTGSVTLSGGGYTSPALTLSSSAASFTIPANSLTIGTVTLSVAYSGDSTYAIASGTATVTVLEVAKLTPTIAVTPSSGSIQVNQALSVAVTVQGSTSTPTGSVILSGGGYTSPALALSSGRVTFTIPAASLSIGTHTLTAAYSGDTMYLSGMGSAAVSVTDALVGTYGMEASVPAAISPGASATSTITVSSNNGYSGTVTLTCVLTSSPVGAKYLPVCSPVSGSTAVTLSPTTTSATVTVVVTTTGAITALIQRRMGTLAGTVFALLVLWVIPHRSRRWTTIQGLLMLLVLLGSATACGGGSGGGGGSGQSGTTPGTYTFTVSGTGNPAISPAPAAIFSVTIN